MCQLVDPARSRGGRTRRLERYALRASRRRSTLAFGWLACALALALPGALWSGEDRTLVAFERAGNVELVTLRGREVFTIESTPRRESEWERSYYAPALSPDQETLALIRCDDIPLNEHHEVETHLRARGPCHLILMEAGKGRRERILLSTEPGVALDSPAFDAAGRRLAVITDDEILLLDSTSGARIASVELDWSVNGDEPYDLVGNQAPAVHSRNYVRWGRQSGELFFYTFLRRAKSFEDVDWARTTEDGRIEVNPPTEEALEELFRAPPGQVARVDFGAGRLEWLLEVEAPARCCDSDPVADHPAVWALFGSPENPRLGAIYSGDGRFYFYYTSTQGWFGKGWIEGYDVATGRKFQVKHLWRSLLVK